MRPLGLEGLGSKVKEVFKDSEVRVSISRFIQTCRLLILSDLERFELHFFSFQLCASHSLIFVSSDS